MSVNDVYKRAGLFKGKRMFSYRNVSESGHFQVSEAKKLKSERTESCLSTRVRFSGQVDVELSPEQEAIAAYCVNSDESVFFTGNAGTGKSVLLRSIIRRLIEKYDQGEVVVTASTGIAALAICGVTLHSFAGVGLGDECIGVLVKKVLGNKKSYKRWSSVKILIIDEISMVDGLFFSKLEELARFIRVKDAPFGGIKLILCGDFMQLPPVSKGSIFTFETSIWGKVVKRIFVLEHIFRQRDLAHINMLNEIRVGVISEQSQNLLKSLKRQPNNGYKTTMLFPLRSQVDKFNEKELSSLPGVTRIFRANDTGELSYASHLDKLIVPKLLKLKIGASVMLIKNLTEVLVNGSVGVVKDFDETTGYPKVLFDVGRSKLEMSVGPEVWKIDTAEGTTLASRTQIPLILSYSISIHKSQGLTFNSVSVDMEGIFESGQAYVALSRASSLDGLQVLNYEKNKIKTNKKVIEFNKRLNDIKTDISTLLPLKESK